MVMAILVWCDTYMYVNPEGGGEAARENPIDGTLGTFKLQPDTRRWSSYEIRTLAVIVNCILPNSPFFKHRRGSVSGDILQYESWYFPQDRKRRHR